MFITIAFLWMCIVGGVGIVALFNGEPLAEVLGTLFANAIIICIFGAIIGFLWMGLRVLL